MRGQILRFVLVGVVNTGTYYALYRLLCLGMPYLAAHVVATLLSMVGSFFMNVGFTYRTRPTWRKFLLFPLSNATNLVLTTAGVYVLVSVLGMDTRIAPLIAAAGAIPATFLVSRLILVPASLREGGSAGGESGDTGRAGDGPPRRSVPWRALRGPALAAGIAMTAFASAGAVRGTYPFGDRSRAINDLGNQFVPFHAHLWDLLHGTSTGDLFFNWNSAFGVPFWADFVSFLANPFSLVVGLFPRDRVDLGVYTGEVLSIGLGAAVMALWLRRLVRAPELPGRPFPPGSPRSPRSPRSQRSSRRADGPWWQTGLLGAAYGLSGWTLNDGTPDPMWLWGLTAFPLMLLALERCRRDGWLLRSAPMVALAWAGNFYTALMAVIGATVVGTVILATRAWTTEPEAGPPPLRFVTRAAAAFALGTLLVAPVLLPAYLASGNAQPIPPLPYVRPPLVEYGLQLLPAQRSEESVPRFFTGMLVLLLVLAFPLNRNVPARTRAVWCAALLVVAASLCWLPSVKLWHGLAQPNGSPYRATLVLTGLLVTVAWLCLTHRPKAVPLLGASAAACLIATVSMHHESGAGPLTLLVVIGSGGSTLALLLIWGHTHHRPTAGRAAALSAAALTAVVLVESATSAVAVDEQRNKQDYFAPKPTWGARHTAVRAAVTGVDGWPAYRTDTGPTDIVNNDPELLGGQGPAYYSSYVPQQTARLMQRLGYAWTMHGRHLMGQDNPVADAVFGIGARVRHSKHTDRARAERFPTPPLVTVQPREVPRPPLGATAFAHQEASLGHRVYELPRATLTGPGGTPRQVRPGGPYRLEAGVSYTLTARCSPRTELYISAPWTDATLTPRGGRPVRLWGAYPQNASPVRKLGPVRGNGRIVARVRPERATELPRSPLGCLDRAKLSRAVARLRVAGATRVDTGGHTLRAALPVGATGTAVVATAPTPGWRCSVDGGPRTVPESRLGLMAMPLPDLPPPDAKRERRLVCSFRPPGLRLAAVASAGAGAALLMAAVVPGIRRRRAARDG